MPFNRVVIGVIVQLLKKRDTFAVLLRQKALVGLFTSLRNVFNDQEIRRKKTATVVYVQFSPLISLNIGEDLYSE